MYYPKTNLLWSLLLSLLFTVSLPAQYLTFNNAVPQNIGFCEDSGDFKIEFTNDFGKKIRNIYIKVEFPQGVSYAGYLSNNSNYTAYEYYTYNSTTVWFWIQQLPKNKTASFNFSAYVNSYGNSAGGDIDNTVQVFFQENNQSSSTSYYSQTTTTDGYEIANSELTVKEVTPLSNAVVSGATFTRTIQVENTGDSKMSSFSIRDNHGSALDIQSVSVGNLNYYGNRISLSSSDFTGFGDGDDSFDPGEIITIEEVISVSGCSDTESEIYARFSCYGSLVYSNVVEAYTSISNETPQIAVTPQASFNTCTSDDPDVQYLTISNNGSGSSEGMFLDIFQHRGEDFEDIFSRVDVENIHYKINNGNFVHLPYWASYHTDCEGPYGCLGYNAMGRFLVSLPDLAGGDEITIRWNSYTCPTDYCGRVDLIGWKYDLYYQNSCNSEDFVTSGVGQEAKGKNVSAIAEYPSDISDGQVEAYTFNFLQTKIDLPTTSGSYIEAVFDLPEGLVVPGNQSNLVFANANTFWSPAYYDYSNGKVTARYAWPTSFDLEDASISLSLGLDCNASTPAIVDGAVDVNFSLTYVMDPSCSNTYELPLICETVTTNLHCTDICSKGMEFLDFTAERSTFGLPDNDLDAQADANGTLDLAAIKLKRVTLGDQFKTTFSGSVKTNWLNDQFEYGYASTTITQGDMLEPISATLQITDVSNGDVLEASNIAFTTSLDGTLRTTRFDFSPSSLAANGSNLFNNYVFEQGDLVTLIPVYEVTGNIGATTESVQMTNTFTLANTIGGNEFSCGTQGDMLTLIGFEYQTGTTETVSFTGCQAELIQSFEFNFGNDDNSSIDYFPYEYRNFSTAYQAGIQIPAGYTVQNTYIRHYRSGGDGSEVEETYPLSAFSTTNNYYQFNLAGALATNGGTVKAADESFKGSLYLELVANCSVEEATTEVTWDFSFQESDLLGAEITVAISGSDELEYHVASLDWSSLEANQEGIAKTVTWNLSLTNNSGLANAQNTWLAIQNASGSIAIEKVTNEDSGTVIYANNGFYTLGELDANASVNLLIEGTYASCDADEIEVLSGFSCTGYPTDLNNLDCEYSTQVLSVVPQDGAWNAALESSSVDENDETYNTLELKIDNLGKAYLQNLTVTVETPGEQSLRLLPDASEVALSGADFAEAETPELEDGQYVYEAADLDADLYKDGLPGTTATGENTLTLRFKVGFMPDFKSGDQLKVSITSNTPCGTTLPVLEFVYDPNQVYSKVTDLGITPGANNWGVSWADYDNDGDPDLFITNYDDDKPNTLYNNKGDGTFDLVTEGVLATDKANSIGSSWGDYDNDGDLDLYVTNTIGMVNFLYRNNGDGDFTRIQDDPVVSYTGYSHGVSWGDYDNDGFLDIFVADLFSTKFNLLYHNNGDGTFEQETTSNIVLDAGSSASGVWGDYDNDGDLDLFVANTNDEDNFLYRNDGNRNFTKILTGPVVNDGGKSVGGTWGDIDNDGDLDLFVSNSGGQDNTLYLNDGDGTFTKATSGEAIAHGGNSHGSSMGDYDNDGDLDLVVTNDAGEDNFFYVNDGSGNFKAIDNAFSSDGGESFGVAWADFDNDGDLDLYVVNHGNNENFFYRNDRDISKAELNYGRTCINVEGTVSNNLAIGTRVSVMATIFGQEVWQTREVQGQTGGGLSAQNDLRQHFGLGDAPEIDSVVIDWPSGLTQTFGPQQIGDCLTFVENGAVQVCGVAYHDANNNCTWDSDETLLPNAAVTVRPGNQTVYTDENGEYSINLAPGSYSLGQTEPNNWTPSCNVSGYAVDVNNEPTADFCGFDFAFAPANAQLLPDLEVSLATTALRVGFESLYAITYGNSGTGAADNTILSVDFGNFIIPIQSSVPWDSVAGNTYFWNLGQLDFGVQRTIYVFDSISTAATISDLAVVQARINSDQTDLLLANNSYNDSNPFVGAFDPNDLLVFPEGAIERDETLTYKVRFQNVGNAEVRTVTIRNELSAELDWTSLELGTASHAMKFSIEDGNQLIWEFENIYLPDSTSNEPESHGFVTYRIKPRADLTAGTEIKNQASIIFDNNDAIITNMTINSIFEKINGEAGTLTIFPNPLTTGNAIIEINPKSANQEEVAIQSILIADASGRVFLKEEGINEVRYRLDKTRLSTGYFVLRIKGEDGNEYIGKLIVY